MVTKKVSGPPSVENKPITNGLQSVHSLLQPEKKVLSHDNGMGKSRSCSWQYNSWEMLPKGTHKKYSTFLNTAELLPGCPRQIFIASILNPFQVGSNAASSLLSKVKWQNSCSCHKCLTYKAGLHQLNPYIRKPPLQFQTHEMILNNHQK